MIDLNDEDLKKIELIYNWMKFQQRTRRHIDQFVKDAEERFANEGYKAVVKVYDTDQEDVYGFEVELQGRTFGTFDPDKMVWEVTNNVLELPNQDKGFIKTDGAAKALMEGDRPKNKGKHHH